MMWPPQSNLGHQKKLISALLLPSGTIPPRSDAVSGLRRTNAMLHRQLMLSLAAIAILCLEAQAQPQNAPPAANPLSSPGAAATNAVAATVNGQVIPELAVSRALRGKTDMVKDKREQVLNYLIENALVDQYLEQLKVVVESKEVEAQLAKVKQEIDANGRKLKDFLAEMHLTEAELQTQVHAGLRWDKFVQQYATEKAVKDYFDANKSVFDGTSMRARHILLTFPVGDGQAAAQAKTRVGQLKKQVEDTVGKELAAAGKLDKLQSEQKRMELTDLVFADLAAKESNCPSKTNGGELGWFPRSGGRVSESFAKAAFALKPGQMSDAVTTEFGIHLILCVDYKAGAERKYEEIREIVKDVYADKMREAIVVRMRPTAKISITPLPK
jgi:peptidyl-prolyl cis-trans isomerase C